MNPEKSRWIDIEKTVNVLKNSQCPKKTALKIHHFNTGTTLPMTNIDTDNKYDPSIMNTFTRNKKAYETKQANRLSKKRPMSRKAQKIVNQPRILAEFSVAFRDNALRQLVSSNANLNNIEDSFDDNRHRQNYSSTTSKKSFFVKARDLRSIFLDVELKLGLSIVSSEKLDDWTKRNHFVGEQALSYGDYMTLCKGMVKAYINEDEEEEEAEAEGMGEAQFVPSGSLDYQTSWDNLPYQNFGESTTTAHAATPQGQSQSQSHLQSSQSSSFIINQRKSAEASLFSFSDRLVEKPATVRVSADEMVELVKKQNREGRKAEKERVRLERIERNRSRRKKLEEEKETLVEEVVQQEEENIKTHVNKSMGMWDKVEEKVAAKVEIPVSAVGQRLFDAQLQSVSVEGEHLAKTSYQEVYRRTQLSKNLSEDRRKVAAKKADMANLLGKKISTVMRQISSSKVKDVKNEGNRNRREVTILRKHEELRAKVERDAVAEREIGEKRLVATMQRGNLNNSLMETKIEQEKQMEFVRSRKDVLRRRSVVSQGFPGTGAPAQGKRKEEKMKYSQSLSEIKGLFDERKGLKKSMSVSEINVGTGGGANIYNNDGFGSPGSQGRPGSPGSPGSPATVLTGIVDKPKTKSQLLPHGMASAERIYGSPENKRESKVDVPFGSMRGRHTPVSILKEIDSGLFKPVGTPVSVLREIGSPNGIGGGGGGGYDGRLLSSPSPWG